MKPDSSVSNRRALTAIELLVFLAVSGILIAVVVLPLLKSRPVPAHGIKCVNNLKQVGSGNVLQADGSVQITTSSHLRELLRTTGDTNNGIAVPD